MRLVLLASAHELSTKATADSGFSVAYFQPARAGRVTAGGAASEEFAARLPEVVFEVATARRSTSPR